MEGWLDEDTHLSQLADDDVNPAAPRWAEGPTDFCGAFAAAAVGAGGGGGGGAGATPAGAANGGAAETTPDAPAGSGPGPQPRPSFTRQGKVINDPVHGTFRLDQYVIDIIDSRQFQRLRRLKQLGLTYYVYPGASHNRFEHSLGVARLGYKQAMHLWNLQRSELGMDKSDVLVVELAGACHDLGHGPFSHVFDRELLRRRGITGWEHEDMSCKMLEAIIDEKCMELPETEVKRVQQLITAGHGGGGASASSFGGKPWLAEIVANWRNGIDVDKFDYLARDSMYCGLKLSCDFNRVMQFSKVIDGEICYKYSEYHNLQELFHSRASMFRQVYTHRKAKAIEFMVVDALLEADPVLRLTEKIWDVNQFVALDDGILELIENSNLLLGGLLRLDEEEEDGLRAAQRIISRLRRRDLYKFCSEVLVPQELLDRNQWRAPSELDIVSCYSGSDVSLRTEDIILNEVKIDHSFGARNPLDCVSFFDDLWSTTKRKLNKESITYMAPSTHMDKTLRVYSRHSSPEYVAAVHQAFQEWARRQFGSSFRGSYTPLKLPPTAEVPAGAVAAALAATGNGLSGLGPGAPVASAAASAAFPAPGGGGGGGVGKRGRDLFGGGAPGSSEDVSPSNLLRVKQRRQLDGSR